VVQDFLEKIIETLSHIAQWILFLMELIIVYDVFARYFFDSPTIWACEISEYMLVFIAFAGAAEIQRRKQHIKMDFFYNRFSQRIRNFLDLIFGIIMGIFSALLFWNSLKMTLTAAHYDARSNSLLAVPLFIPYAIVPVGMGMLMLQSLLDIIKSSNELIFARPRR